MSSTVSRPATAGPAVLTGTPVVPGAAVGPVVRPVGVIRLPTDDGAEVPVAEREPEKARYGAAAETVAERLTSRAAAATGVSAEVLSTTAGIARDRALRTAAEQRIDAGAPAAVAAVQAAQQFMDMFAALGGLMAERVPDVRDVRDRIVAELTGQGEPGVPAPDVPSILLADDLAPADTAGLDPARILGLATRLGGTTSHTAIIARQLGLPCVVGVGGLDAVPAGATVLVDGEQGTVTVDPEPEQARARVAAARLAADALAAYRGPGRTKDGHVVQVLANVQDGAGARAAARAHAEGVGLFRTELAFLGRAEEPSVEEQATGYAEVLAAFPGRKVVVRTLDAGSDKPLAFATPPDEANPALGVRGLRVARRDPGLLERQLDAIAEAAARTASTPWVMAPMVATVPEAAGFAAAVRGRGLVPGVMIEVPSAVLHAERLLAHVDFLSIGTNDLSQYALAADRLSADLAELTDPWQPALLELVALTAAAGRRAGKPVGVCGEAAADPLLGCVLVGLGITSLSCATSAVAGVGARLSTVELDACRRAAEAALATDEPLAARTAAREALAGT
ncbi:phosphoenolpyruvate--protein phosphotransferase [Blastococcus sp. MG754426]|uniref:putative PEP-binding protein n=1 Tax=unclassified Blastococcus TaxID=2619396 RepID=UPI001EEDA6DA|nr:MULTISPECIES: putative PEP-binding protein [unclassified Blastococcus]MCF6509234.1 phosphoenolpyruvate--protein phosphotransferase [Blastococcus sp. MG754426]MCF6513802.1 phosphoenolpyruvate--protein phosphotransferase [Blastococcus sp. MG754427]